MTPARSHCGPLFTRTASACRTRRFRSMPTEHGGPELRSGNNAQRESVITAIPQQQV